MSVSEIKKANGEVMRIIDGEYVIGANGGCFNNPSPCRKVINGNYLVERKCGCSGGCIYDEYYDGGDSLDLYSKHLIFLNKCIGCYKNLKYLDLDFNNLTTLPDTIGNLSSLQSLELSDNQLTTLPDIIGNLSSLKYLYLYRNQLTTLPDSIGDLSSLKYLNLDFNNLTTLPDTIGNLDNDNIYIYLRNNNFTEDYKDHIRNDLFPIANANGHLYL